MAASSALALLVAVPLGIRLGLAVAARAPLADALDAAPLLLDLATAGAWVGGLFLPLAALSARFDGLRRAPLARAVFLLGLIAGVFGWYRLEPPPSRLLFAAQYALLVALAYLLFDFLAIFREQRKALQRGAAGRDEIGVARARGAEGSANIVRDRSRPSHMTATSRRSMKTRRRCDG